MGHQSESPPLTALQFADLINVSRETIEKLQVYIDTLRAWQPKLNLVGASTLRDPWRRHILDSAQLIGHLPEGQQILADLGSGAGFPGMVISLMTGRPVQLIESNSRKCAFLREVVRQTGANVLVRDARIESLSPVNEIKILTARACAPLERLLSYAAVMGCPDAVCLFLKGRNVQGELTDSKKVWDISYTLSDSLSDPSGVVLKISAFSRRHAS